MKKKIEINVSFKGRFELFWMKYKLFGIGKPFGIEFKDVKELFHAKKLEALFG